MRARRVPVATVPSEVRVPHPQSAAQAYLHSAASWLKAQFFLHSKDRLDALEGVRGLAILLGLTLHFFMLIRAATKFLPARSPFSTLMRIISVGQQGVDLFFILSSFLIF